MTKMPRQWGNPEQFHINYRAEIARIFRVPARFLPTEEEMKCISRREVNYSEANTISVDSFLRMSALDVEYHAHSNEQDKALWRSLTTPVIVTPVIAP